MIYCGHNINGFDLPFLFHRSVILNIPVPQGYPSPRFHHSPPIMTHDTMVMWAGMRDYVKMDSICKALGMAGKKGIDGSMVYGMMLDGKEKQVADYCVDDGENVRKIHKRLVHVMGLKTGIQDVLYFDIETIPSQKPGIKKDIAATIKHPGSMSKPDTIAKWNAEQKPYAIEEAYKKTALDGMYGEVACIAWAFNDEPFNVVYRRLDEDKEAILISDLYNSINGR